MKQKLIFSAFVFLASTLGFAQPRWVISCNSGAPSYRSLNIYDDGRDYHIKLVAKSFAPYYSSPVLQTLSAGEYSFQIAKDKCSLKDSAMACLSWSDLPVNVNGTRYEGGVISGTLPVRRASFKISQVSKKEIHFMSTGPELKTEEHDVVSLSLLTRDPKLERVGAFVEFSAVSKCHFF